MLAFSLLSSCRWLTFIRGVVDSDDLPLNVGREILQKSQMLRVVHKRVAAKAVEMIQAIKRQGSEKWDRFWENYGKYIKVGAYTPELCIQVSVHIQVSSFFYFSPILRRFIFVLNIFYLFSFFLFSSTSVSQWKGAA